MLRVSQAQQETPFDVRGSRTHKRCLCSHELRVGDILAAEQEKSHESVRAELSMGRPCADDHEGMKQVQQAQKRARRVLKMFCRQCSTVVNLVVEMEDEL